MQAQFRIHFNTRWGQHLGMLTNASEKAILLQAQPNGWWQLALTLPSSSAFQYRYVLCDGQGQVLETEFGDWRTLPALKKGEHPSVEDAWRSNNHPDNPLYSSAFTEVIFKPAATSVVKGASSSKGSTRLVLRLHQVRVPHSLQLAVLGNHPALGNWEAANALLMSASGYPCWEATCYAEPGTQLEYKYVLLDPTTKEVVHWERGDNRQLSVATDAPVLVHTDQYFQHPQGTWKGVGVAVPVFSLRSEQSCGIGEFSDLPGFVDWAVSTGMQMVQILPINDTTSTFTWVDSYPYSAISVFALHPVYLHLDALEAKPAKATHDKQRKALNALAEIDYEAVLQYKLKTARASYDKYGAKTLASAEFQAFLGDNHHWLLPYAAFCYLRDQHGTADFLQWPAEDRVYDAARIEALAAAGSPAYKELGFHYYLQFHLDKQLSQAAAYARSKGVVLKGDIAIGIDRKSADAWVAPALYNMEGQAGAPPDAFAAEGQNWGFPTYNWARMAEDGYQWWKQRFSQLGRYFDAFRIDHILGFFRIWETPYEHTQGIMGRFNPALPILLEEFYQRGLYFDYDRFCKPFINWEILRHLFGEDAPQVARHYLVQTSEDRFQMAEQYSGQRALEAALPKEHQAWKAGLLQLISNVLFFQEESNTNHFHPRIQLFDTLSFRYLDGYTQGQLRALHDDYFYNRQEEFWRQQGMTKLPAIKAATNMLICGEDLGMVPACVPDVMKHLGILSLEIQRMSKNPKTEFLAEKDIPYWSVCSPSTHDMPPLRLWWEEEEPARRQRYYNQELGWWGEAPGQCSPEIAAAVLNQHLQWPAMWVVFPVQDYLAIDAELRRANPADERINIPAIIKHYWRYRLHLSNEELQNANAFNERLKSLFQSTGRG